MMNKKKILIIMQSLTGGGAEKVFIDILNWFDTERYDVSLCVLYKDRVPTKEIKKNIKLLPYYRYYTFFQLFGKACRRIKLMGIYYFIARILFSRFIKPEYDVTISFMEGNTLRYHSFIFDKCDKNISWVHLNLNKLHYSLASFKNIQQEEQIYNQLSGIVFVSEDAKAEFNKLFTVTKPVQKVVYNLIDKEDILCKSKEREVEKQKFTIFCIGRLDFQKRFDRAINVAKILKDKGLDFELWILGKGALESELKKQVSSFNLTDCVKFWGFVENPYPMMKTADLFLMTSDTEGYPLVVCEALCLGLPVVSTNITGSNEILEDGKYGVLTGFQETEIAHVLSELMSNPIQLKNLSLLSQERAKIFNPKNTMEEIYDLLENC